ncbi:uncharacterized protein TM35_000042140 [Trypanosoma theileri]|uniref:SET domain-containing protein n=1 Tax=Trypanosoma theileri TaxID=67003 RepID=A0A1X0P6E3_9TRYP|nr:uncharacterized protein TM35_000042140 [Trypanosoma theileri]ORC92000.1 hypothetical protein TM35_000042140 [Trypanosoma theileri]
MKTNTSFKAGEIICPISADYTFEHGELVLPDGNHVRHGAKFNATIISRFIITTEDLAEGQEVLVDLNTFVYEAVESQQMQIPGFKNLPDVEKQRLYTYADERVRQQAIADGFIPRRSESGMDVVRTASKSSLVTVSRGNHEAQSVVFTSTGVLLPFPVRSTIELPGERHLRLTGGSEFIRHACQPNLCLEIDGDCIRAIALRPIEDGEQLTCNYLYTEWDIAQPFCCACNTYSCYGFVRGFRYLDAEQQMHLLPYASAAIKEKYHAPSLSTASLTLLKENTAMSLTFEGRVAAQRYIDSGTVLFHVNRFRVQPREVIIDNLQIPHSCDANCVLLESRLVTTRPLLPGDLITLNISTLFYEVPLPFDCLCGSHNCTHLVKGFSSLSDSEKNRLMTFTDISIVTEAFRNVSSIESSSPLVKIIRDPLIGYVTSAEHFIPKGTRIFHVNGFILPFPTIYTVFLGEGKHLLFSEGAQYLGHSCEPNTRLYVDASNGIADCVATRDIQPGELVGFNYLTSEWDMAIPFKCRCGSLSCHGVIKGFRHLDERTQLKLWPQTTTGVKLLFKQNRRSALPTLNNSIVTFHENTNELCVARDMPSGIILFEATGFNVIGDEIVLDDIRLKHSCNPTALWLEGYVVLCRASLRGDAVTLNINHLIYSTTTPFVCRCGFSNCVQTVSGFAGLTDDRKEMEMLYVDPQVRATAVNNGYCIRSSSPLVEVKANGRMGQATFAKEDIIKGTRFFNVTGLVLPFPTIYTILIADKQHLLFADGAQCLAHSCDPNVRIIVDSTARRIECVALRNIKKNELISFNYLTTEWDMQTPFTCLCGAANCYHDIRGFKYLRDELRQNLWSITTPAIASLAAVEKGVDAWMQIASERLFLENDGSVHIGDNMKEGIVLINVSSLEIRDGFIYIDGLRLRHHCSPTAALIDDKIVLIRTVNRGDELTVDLNCLRYEFPKEFVCKCNRFKHEHIINGFKYLEEREKCSRIVFTELSVRSAALRDGYKLECYSSSLVEIQKGNTGMEAYAATNISSGRRFMKVTGLCLPFASVGTIQLEEKKHLLLSDGAQFILHSCNPNIRMCVDAVNNTVTCEALRDIESGELITFNYLTTEWELCAPFRCECGNENCLHDIRGFKFLTGAQRMHLQRQVTPFIRNMANRHTFIQLPSFLKKNTNGMLQLTNTVTRGTVLLESSDIDIQPTQVSLGGDAYIIQHNANPNAVFVEGRFIALRTIEEGEVITVDMNLFIYDMKVFFPHAFAEEVKGFRHLDDKEKQRKLYLCEPPVRAQAMHDGWIVKSTSPLIEVRPNGKMGQTAYALKDIPQGEKLFHLTGLVVPFPTMYTICVGDDKHLLFGDAAECIAHHCEPNVQVIVHEEDDSLEFVTFKPIAAGEMVTFNYCSTEWTMNTPFVCLCASEHCSHTIRGFSHLSKADRQRLWPITSTVVRRYASREGH